jgi:hypothetical protein
MPRNLEIRQFGWRWMLHNINPTGIAPIQKFEKRDRRAFFGELRLKRTKSEMRAKTIKSGWSTFLTILCESPASCIAIVSIAAPIPDMKSPR